MQHSPIDLLVIDDSPEDREIVGDLLSRADRSYIIREARTAAEGVAEFGRQRPDCVLLDYNLPDADGLSCLQHFRKPTEELSCAVILLTGKVSRKITQRALSEGVQDFLPKSELTTGVLERAVDHALLRCRLVQERAEALYALADNERLLRLAQEAAGIGTFSWNLQTNQTEFGGAYFSLYGLNPDTTEMSFTEWLSLIHPADRERVKEETDQAIATGGQFSYEYRVVWPDQSLHWQLGRGAVVHDDHGRPLKLTGVNIDITASKFLQQALVDANAELRHFAYAAGHDLQAPLRTVSVFTEMLERTLGSQVDDKARQALAFVRSSSDRMGHLVSDLLAYAQSGGVAEAPVRLVSLREPLQAALENLNSDIISTGAVIGWDEELPAVLSAGEELSRVLQNLIANAIKYRRTGVPPEIYISAQLQSQKWLISVRDNGTGFDMHHASFIFLPFKRLAGFDTPGTGLGLSICKRIIERMGGRIWATSVPGEGSTFSFTLAVPTSAHFG